MTVAFRAFFAAFDFRTPSGFSRLCATGEELLDDSGIAATWLAAAMAAALAASTRCNCRSRCFRQRIITVWPMARMKSREWSVRMWWSSDMRYLKRRRQKAHFNGRAKVKSLFIIQNCKRLLEDEDLLRQFYRKTLRHLAVSICSRIFISFEARVIILCDIILHTYLIIYRYPVSSREIF